MSPIEISWRSFRAEMDKEMGIVAPEPEERPTPKSLQRRRDVHNGRFSKPPKLRINPNPNAIPRPGEIPLKQFLTEESVRLNTKPKTIYSRWSKGEYTNLKIRRVNQRIVFVTVP
jgi:hypothetical protein